MRKNTYNDLKLNDDIERIRRSDVQETPAGCRRLQAELAMAISTSSSYGRFDKAHGRRRGHHPWNDNYVIYPHRLTNLIFLRTLRPGAALR
jgi:hypothetical protein